MGCPRHEWNARAGWSSAGWSGWSVIIIIYGKSDKTGLYHGNFGVVCKLKINLAVAKISAITCPLRRYAITHTCTHTSTKVFRSVINGMHKSNFWLQFLLKKLPPFDQGMFLFLCYYQKDGCCWLSN